MKIRPVRAKLFHADRHDEANSRFSQFCNAPKNGTTLSFKLRPPYTGKQSEVSFGQDRMAESTYSVKWAATADRGKDVNRSSYLATSESRLSHSAITSSPAQWQLYLYRCTKKLVDEKITDPIKYQTQLSATEFNNKSNTSVRNVQRST
jgi:hypothetical protein